MINLNVFLAKIDYRLSPHASSRASYQVDLILKVLHKLNKGKFKNVLDVGGGFDGRYRSQITDISIKYQNLEIEPGPNVDLVGSAYKLPTNSLYNLITSFMVLEHLNEPLKALRESNRVLTKKGYLALTTVQYWHTHSHPSDYYRYTRYGLEYLLKQSGFKVVKIWSHGGPFLVLFHVIELNLPNWSRTIYSICFYRMMDFLDSYFFKHEDKRKPNNDSVGWSVIAQKI